MFARILSVANMPRKGIKLAVYGQAKTGKTQFACTFPGPVLIMGTEDGTATIDPRRTDVDFLRVKSSDDIDRVTARIRDGWKYKSVAVDTAGGMQDIFLKEIAGLNDIPITRNWGIATQQQWGQITGWTKERLARLFHLAEDPAVALNVVVIAHERTFGAGNDPETGGEIVNPVVGASLTPIAARWLDGAVDYLCQTFKRPQWKVHKVKAAGKETEQLVKTGKIEYCLRTGPHQYFLTGFRLPGGRQPPDAIVNPDYDKVMKVIKNLPLEDKK